MGKGKGSNDYLMAACDLDNELDDMINWKGMRYLVLSFSDEGEYPALQICRLKSTATKGKKEYLKDMKESLQDSLEEYYESENEDWYTCFDSIEQLKEYFKDVRIKIIPIDFSNTICDEDLNEELKKIKDKKIIFN